MSINVAINGYGRIGRNILRAHYEYQKYSDLNIVAINDLAPAATSAHLTRVDSVHGPFEGTVELSAEHLIVNGDPIKVFSEPEPSKLPWGELGVDIVHECTGRFRTKEAAGAHLKAGAGKVLLSAPGGANIDATVVYGVNNDVLMPSHTVVSNASCTTNCLSPVLKVLHDAMEVEHGLMTTIHAFTNGQVLIDRAHKDLRRARAATLSMIPTTTGAAAAVGKVLPALAGKLDGYAVRVPTANVSMVDLTFRPGRSTSEDEIHKLMAAAAKGKLQGVLDYSDAPLVSIDFNHHPASSIFDASQTRIIDGRLVKIAAWYDNEWGFSNRMLDTTYAWMSL